MSPLIDCIFLLLIFFVVTSVFVDETGVSIDRPRAVSSKNLDKNSMMIALTADGDIVYSGNRMDLNSIRGAVSRQMREREVPVIIIADKNSLSGQLVQLLDECKLAGAKQVSVAAQNGEQ